MSAVSLSPCLMRAVVPTLLTLLLWSIAHAAPASGTSQLTTLYNFAAVSGNYENSNGANPEAGLVVGKDGNFYGTTFEGGANGTGTVLKVTPSGTLTTLHTFSAVNNGANSDGARPAEALVMGPDGNFYGTTYVGGANGTGTVFKVTPSETLTTLHTFSAVNNGANSDGAQANALVAGPDGNFYGTTEDGGSGSGTVFKITPGGILTTLHTFSADINTTDGTSPQAALVVGSDGNFYGTTESGGLNDNGTVFKLTSGGVLTILYSFSAWTGGSPPYTNSDGFDPLAALVMGPNGNFYGTTQSGGTNGTGTVFQITPTGTLSTLHSFSAFDSYLGPNSDGAQPGEALVVGLDGNFYGTTNGGGANGTGTVFKITPLGTLTTLYTFSAVNGNHKNSDGVRPKSLIMGQDGDFYGTTDGGGANGTGTIFTLTVPVSASIWKAVAVGAGPSGTDTILWNRGDGAAGVWALGANDAETVIGTTYGPYAGWTAKAIATANDGTSRVLWTNTNGQAGVWTFNASGTETVIGPIYCPYAGWSAGAIGVAGDGTSRVLWTSTNGQAGVWSFSTNDAETLIGPAYGPISGWEAVSLATANDGTSRMLWNRSDKAAGLWSFGTNDAVSVYGDVYGPYTGWTAKAVGSASDGTSRVLWANTNGDAGMWSFDTNGMNTLIGTTYGPYSGWTAGALATSSDGTSRVLWTNATYATGVWSFTAEDAESIVGATYGPY